MVERRPPKTRQQYQPLPAGQTLIILTDKTQLMPKDLTENDFSNPNTTEEVTANPTDRVQPKIKNNKTIANVSPAVKDGCCRVTYSFDMLEAFLLIDPPNGGKWPELNEATMIIQSENILDYDRNAVVDAIEHHRTKPVRIAQGTPPVNGQDTDLKIDYELKDLHKIYIEGLVSDEFGRVDYHQVKTVQTVMMGDRVAQKIMCSPGEDGIDVHGRKIPAVPGTDRPIKLGKNVTWDEGGLYIVATDNGKPTLINDILNVIPTHEIHDNVDFHTGNINFDGDLVIYGNVEHGFTVEAGGDIVIMGYVEAAEIIAGGKLSIKGRVFGNDKGKLICGGDFYAKEVEHVTILCKGTVTVNEAILHCRVLAEKKVVAENGRGWIVGGSVHAGEEISARIIGSRLNTITDLEIGPNVKLKIDDYQNTNYQTGSDAIMAFEAGYTEGTVCPQLPETPLPNSIETDNSQKPKGRIRFKDMMYPGVRVSFEPFKFIIQNELTFGSLTCHEGYLHLLPYR